MTYLGRYNSVLLISLFSKSKSQAPENEILQNDRNVLFWFSVTWLPKHTSNDLFPDGTKGYKLFLLFTCSVNKLKAKTSFNFIISWNSEVGFFKAYTANNFLSPDTVALIYITWLFLPFN